MGLGVSLMLADRAACEVDGRGQLICARGGAAVDLGIEGVEAAAVVAAIAQLGFDRVYFYGDDRPVHVSAGPERNGVIIEVVDGPRGRRPGRRWDAAGWLGR